MPLRLVDDASTAAVPAILEHVSTQPAIAEFGPYRARLAVTQEDCEAAFHLRYLVFNLELNEGLESAFSTGMDSDRYDECCDHLIVEHKATGAVIGTYRLQTGRAAAANYGYYSEQEFHFTPYEHLRSQLLELGRACIHRDHRSAEVLNLLWRGIMRYAKARNIRFLIGCCSLNSQDEREGMAVFAGLREYCVAPELFTLPTQEYACRAKAPDYTQAPPKLLRAYLAIGARICSPPAIDREFRTIDFLTMIDLDKINPSVARRYL